MSHELSERSWQQGRKQAWHKLTKIKERLTFEDSPLDWTLSRRPLFTKIGDEYVEHPQSVMVASDDGLPVGDAVKGSYGIIQNRALWDALIKGLDDACIKYAVESVGAYNDRRKVSISILLNEGSRFKVGDREIEFCLSALSSHDGSSLALFLDHSTTIVCANTYAMAVNRFENSDGAIRFKVKHTSGSALALDNVSKGIDNLISNRALFCAEMEKLGDVKVKEDDAFAFATGLIAPESADEAGISTRSRNIAEQITQLFKTGLGNKGENRLDIFQGFTDFYSHFSSGTRGKMAQVVSSEFGMGARMKTKAFEALRNENVFKDTIKRGNGLILVS